MKRVGKHIARALPPAGRSGFRSVVLCYHSVHPGGALDSVTPSQFESHLSWFAEHCQIVPLQDIQQRSSATTKPRVAITFDDGYRDNYQFALPRLLDQGFTATFFLIAGFIDGDRAVRERLASAWGVSPDEVAPLAWGDVRAMRAEGMEFGSHTWSHANLARLEKAAAAHELVHSKELIQERLGEEIASVAYPFGKPRRHVTDEVISLAAEAGYQRGVVIVPRGVRCPTIDYGFPDSHLGKNLWPACPRRYPERWTGMACSRSSFLPGWTGSSSPPLL